MLTRFLDPLLTLVKLRISFIERVSKILSQVSNGRSSISVFMTVVKSALVVSALIELMVFELIEVLVSESMKLMVLELIELCGATCCCLFCCVAMVT